MIDHVVAEGVSYRNGPPGTNADRRHRHECQARQLPYCYYAQLLGYYLLFGAIHELAHVVVAAYCFGSSPPFVAVASSSSSSINFVEFWGSVLFLRRSAFEGSGGATEEQEEQQHEPFIRHVGWIASVVVAACLMLVSNRPAKKNVRTGTLTPSSSFSCSLSSARWAAVLTAVEAVYTDLLGLPVIPLFFVVRSGHPSVASRAYYYCGNFGILLLHQAWWNGRDCSNDGNWTSALDVLEKMVQVTMMRGAQSGGVVTYLNGAYRKVRVVNYKRTSLAELVRKALQRKLPRSMPVPSSPAAPTAVAFSGHTRFATSSKATLEGTHPQQWTPATTWRVWNASAKSRRGATRAGAFVPTKIDNYITHNGDFEFYVFRGRMYDLNAIQHFLSIVTGIPTPASVDSCAVAGMVDVLRTKGCFALSIRYALCCEYPLDQSFLTIGDTHTCSHIFLFLYAASFFTVGLSTSTFDVRHGAFPNKLQLNDIAAVFEDAFHEMYGQTSRNIKLMQKNENRAALARTVAQTLYQRKTELLSPNLILKRYITKADLMEDLEQPADAGAGGGSSLFSFCLAAIDAFYDNDLFMTMKTFLSSAKGSFGLCFTSSLDASRQICLAARGQTMSLAFYPSKGLVCYGSEQAAVKAGINVDFPGHDIDGLGRSRGEIDNDALRLDLDVS